MLNKYRVKKKKRSRTEKDQLENNIEKELEQISEQRRKEQQQQQKL